jgi:xanthine dehydrogenase YagS FAD-binding subunit
MLPNFDYVRATSLKAATAHAARAGACIHAGGTDLLGCLRDRVFAADTVVSIADLAELRGVKPTGDGGLRIGALTTVADVAGAPLVAERFRAVAEAAADVASPQLRNQGTIGGNLCQKPRCWYYRGDFHCLRKGGETCFAYDGENQYHCILGGSPCYIVHPSDIAAALVAFDALVRVQGPGGARSVAMAKFHVPPSVNPQRETVLEPGEIVTEVVLPAPPSGVRSSYRKVRARRSWDFALAGVALVLARNGDTVTHARVVLSGAAPVPWRSRAAERLLAGKVVNEETAGKVAAAALEGADPLSGNAYKVPLFDALIRQVLLDLA